MKIQLSSSIVKPQACEICECPTACQQIYNYFYGEFIRPLPGFPGGFDLVTCTEKQRELQRPRFQCPPPGNCSLPIGWVNDNHCDCPGTCADEENWDCDTCVCPDVCGIRNRNCFDVYFACPLSNCTISIFSLNDGNCDCPGCEDESNFTCNTCASGCPTNQTCHHLYVYSCEPRPLLCPGTDRCRIPVSYLNDDFCDCPGCTDEVAWDCGNCSSGRCKSTQDCDFQNPAQGFGLFEGERGVNQQRAVNCFGQQFNLNFVVQCPGYPARSGFPATKLGCTIPFASVNDNRCDCPTCRDEALEDCIDTACSSSVFCSPGGVNSRICKCPSSCGEPTSCAGKCTGDPLLYGTGGRNSVTVPPQLPPECIYFCPGASCGKHVQILNNSVCDCVNCEDEADWSCDTCQCPAAPLGGFDFNEQGCGFQPLDVVVQGKGRLEDSFRSKLPCFFPAPFPTKKLPDGIDGSITHELLERASKTSRNNKMELALNDLVNRALAADDVQKAIEFATAEGPTRPALQAELDALSTAIGMGPNSEAYGLVRSALAERDVQKVLENCVTKGFSEAAKEDVRHLVLQKVMAPRHGKLEEMTAPYLPSTLPSAGDRTSSPRGLQASGDFLELFKPIDRFDCPGTECFIAQSAVNDRICDCPGCEDEEAFGCDGCIPLVPFGAPVPAQTNLGVAVGVSLGVAVGVGLGVGLGVSAALSGVFAAVGLVQQGLKKAFIRLAGLAIAEAAVTLNWACAGDALARLNSKLRRLGEAVKLQGLKKAFIRLAGLAIAEAAVTLNWACAGDALARFEWALPDWNREFQIRVGTAGLQTRGAVALPDLNRKPQIAVGTAGLQPRLPDDFNRDCQIAVGTAGLQREQQSLDACELLAGTSPGNAARVINEELKAVSDQEVQVVQWTANPNPLSKDPTQNAEAPRSFEAPKAVGLDSAALPVPGPLGPSTVAQDAVPTPAVGDGFDPSRGIDFN
eukprot:s824_g22.t1